ncbi:uncharacterized protein LOC106089798 [Stomoxys calcitrans]|uniref:uncharacterized protein LOC106089798 n=1 Tax=Stomoxys calcitrans TaxID=35570 RepID=UPI0027E2F0AB|nr:uncharacterized protein LOC106089798 [Stomoxys calcitrans]
MDSTPEDSIAMAEDLKNEEGVSNMDNKMEIPPVFEDQMVEDIPTKKHKLDEGASGEQQQTSDFENNQHVPAQNEEAFKMESMQKPQIDIDSNVTRNVDEQPKAENTAEEGKISQTIPGKNPSFSLKSQEKKSEDTEESGSNSYMPEQLLAVISNLYLNIGERLRLDFLPRCLDDLAHCHRHHYLSDLPEAPIPTQAHSLRSALQQYRYVSFINSTTDMVHRGEFPGKGIFTKLIELVLSINFNNKRENIAIFEQSYHKSIGLFSMIVRTFPPCWHKLRTYYVGFLEYGLDQAKLGNVKKDELLSKSTKIFDIILDLLEDVLKNVEADVLSNSEALENDSSLTQITSPEHSMDLSVCTEYWNQNEYEERERQKQTFNALPTAQKIERIFVCLRLLLEILEYDLAMWMLHHFKKTKEWIFSNDNRPLIVVLCELTQYTRMTRVARRIFSVYSEAANKGLCKQRLSVLERYISLLMVASNTADMENTAIGVKYPSLGEQTKTLIKEFFKIFKSHNREQISKYMETINLLRIPYVRYEFIDNVLFTNTEPLTPQKIAVDIAKKRWMKYKPLSELSKPDEDISREQYLQLLLDALRQYCEWHGSKTFLHVIADYAKISHLSTTTDSVHRWPTHGSGVLVLKKMAKDIDQLENQLKMTVRMSKPKVKISLADICIDETIISIYRNDLKHILMLQNVILKQKETYHEVDFAEWIKYLSNFPSKKITREEPQQQQSCD